jgi:hypothetical protein
MAAGCRRRWRHSAGRAKVGCGPRSESSRVRGSVAFELGLRVAATHVQVRHRRDVAGGHDHYLCVIEHNPALEQRAIQYQRLVLAALAARVQAKARGLRRIGLQWGRQGEKKTSD